MAVTVYNVNIGSGTDPLDVADFNDKASVQVPSPEEGSQGIFVDSSGASVMPTGRYYTYNNNLWFLNILSTDFEDLEIGMAQTFRESLNENFSQISDQADTVDKNLCELRDNLKPIATTGALSDLTEDSTHRVVTDAEKVSWNARGIYSEDDPSTGVNRVYWQDGNGGTPVDITTKLAAFITASIPSTTQDLGPYTTTSGDCDFILVDKDHYSQPDIKYVQVTKNDLTVDSTTPYYGASNTITFSNSSITADHIPYVFFNQAGYEAGGFTSTCESGTGYIKFGSSVISSREGFPEGFQATIIIMTKQDLT